MVMKFNCVSRTRPLSIGIVLCALAGLTGHAAAQPDSCLSFETALLLAAERAPEVAGAAARQDEAAADYREAESLRLPQVSTFGRTASGDSGLTGSQIENQVGVRLSQRLYDFGDSHYAMAAASRSIDQRAHELRTQQIDASSRLADA